MMGAPKKYFSDEERREARRRTVAKYDRSEKGKASSRRANADPKAKERYARYRLTEKYRAAQTRYHASEQWAEVAKKNLTLQKQNFPERVKARAAVAAALRRGEIRRPDACSCGNGQLLDAHHSAGYSPEKWLIIEWLCRSCHRRRHLAEA